MDLLIAFWGMVSIVLAYRYGVSKGWEKHAVTASSLVQDLALQTQDLKMKSSLEKAAGIVLWTPKSHGAKVRQD